MKRNKTLEIICLTVAALLIFGCGLFLGSRISSVRAVEEINPYEVYYKENGTCEICGKKNCEVYLWKGKYHCVECFDKAK